MVMLYKDPNGERVFSENEEKAKQVTIILAGTPMGESEVEELKAKIKSLEAEIAEHKV